MISYSRSTAPDHPSSPPPQIEKTRAYLGGDATHSILVKGLDYALLAARKAELERQGEEVADDELDALVGRGQATEKKVVKEVKEEGMSGRVSLDLLSKDSFNGRWVVQVDRAEEGGSGGGRGGEEEEEEEEGQN